MAALLGTRCAVVVVVLLVGLAAAATTVDVNTVYGPLRGTTDGRVSTFLGVPFAAPPVDELRWAPPVPPTPHSGVLECFVEGPACMQKPNKLFKLPGISEDCLYLNVYSPTTFSEPVPVMVWIHGGSFGYGTASESKYNATLLVESENVVVVTINYRLGLFGFLASSAFLNENPDMPSTGLYGMLDQQQALKWVQENIANFGGDPTRVTLFGESAGGMSVCVQLGMQSSVGLFHRAIIESGPCNGYKPLDMALADGANFTMIMDCDGLPSDAATRDCLRGKSAADVLIHQRQFPQIGPIVDGFLLPKEPINMIRDNKWNTVPVILGSNTNEGGLFVDVMFSPNITNDEYYDIIKSYIGPVLTPVVYGMYPPIAYGGSAGKALAALIGDMIFTCPTQNAAVAVSLSSNAYAYLFAHTPSWVPQSAGAYHGSEIPFVYGQSDTEAQFSSAERQLSDRMQAYWGSFAYSGDPNRPTKQATEWPLYNDDQRPRIVFDTTAQLKVNQKYRQKECAFWNTAYSLAGTVINGRINSFIKNLNEAEAELAGEYLY